MRSSVFAGLAAAFMALAANAYTTPVGDPLGNPIAKPGLQEQVPAGKPFAITWEPTTAGTVTILLLRGPSENIKPLYPIVEKIPNTGKYEWTPSTALEDDVTHYGIQLIVDATGQYQYSTQFGISNKGVALSVRSSSSFSSSSISSISSSSYITSSALATPGVAKDVVFKTDMLTLTSCHPTVTNCPGRSAAPPAPAPPVPTGNASPPPPFSYPNSTTSTSWNGTASSGFPLPSANISGHKPPVFEGSASTVKMGSATAIIAVFVAGLALAL